MIKPRLHREPGGDVSEDPSRVIAQRVLVGVLDSLVRMLGPTTPFLAEELWHRLGELAPVRGLPEPQEVPESVMVAAWPTPPPEWQDTALEERFQSLQEAIVAVRNIRSLYNIPRSTRLQLLVRCAAETTAGLEEIAGQFINLANTELAEVGPDVQRPDGAASFALGKTDGFIPLEGIIDREAELARHRGELEKLEGVIGSHEKKLANENFVAKAPQDVVDGVRQTLAGLKQQAESVRETLVQLGQ